MSAYHDTIFALSSGALPAAIAVVRVSGPLAATVLPALAAKPVPPRHAAVRILRDPVDGGFLDEALCLFFPSPNSATGDDLLELHCHGSRAVVSRLFAILIESGLREAEAGEFTRRAFANGRMDLNQADGLAELLSAEDERARKAAGAAYQGQFSRAVETWQDEVLRLSAFVETQLDFADEDDVGEGDARAVADGIAALAADMRALLAHPPAERLHQGLSVVIAGPPNSGKSTLLNRLAGREAAIVSPYAGTTRDLIELPVRIAGRAFLLTDSAGLRADTDDAIEAIGIARATSAIAAADIVLWLGGEGAAPDHDHRLEIAARSDCTDFIPKGTGAITLSAETGEGVDVLLDRLVALGDTLLPPADIVALNRRQRTLLVEAADHLDAAGTTHDWLIRGEMLRLTRGALDKITGRAATEDMLDTLFGRFCIGK
jgi:tRNA modification GTPase